MPRQIQITPETSSLQGETRYSKNEALPAVPPSYTVEEIARAIAELEKERSLAKASQSGAIHIADILNQMHLELPVAAVAAKIDQERVARAQEHKTVRRQQIFSVGIVVLFFCLVAAGYFGTRGQNIASVPTVPLDQIVGTDNSTGIPIKKTLAEVPEDVTVSVSGDQLGRLLGARDMETGNRANWEMFQKEGIWYVTGYTDAAQSPNALMAAERTPIQNNRESLDSPVSIQVPVNDIQAEDSVVTPSSDNDEMQRMYVRFKRADRIVFP